MDWRKFSQSHLADWNMPPKNRGRDLLEELSWSYVWKNKAIDNKKRPKLGIWSCSTSLSWECKLGCPSIWLHSSLAMSQYLPRFTIRPEQKEMPSMPSWVSSNDDHEESWNPPGKVMNCPYVFQPKNPLAVSRSASLAGMTSLRSWGIVKSWSFSECLVLANLGLGDTLKILVSMHVHKSIQIYNNKYVYNYIIYISLCMCFYEKVGFPSLIQFRLAFCAPRRPAFPSILGPNR